MKYSAGKYCHFDADQELFYIYVGPEASDMPLHYTVWGKTETECRVRSLYLIFVLNKEIGRE